MMHDVRQALQDLRSANPLLDRPRPPAPRRAHRLHKVLVANRGEIAKRFFFVLKEEGIPSVAIVTDPDRRQSWYEFADEVVYIGDARHYASIPVVLAALLLSKADALYPGYGFLSRPVHIEVQIFNGMAVGIRQARSSGATRRSSKRPATSSSTTGRS